MADTKISALTANATPAFEDLLTTIDDPGGTPASRKTTIEELLTASVAAANTSLFSPTGYSLTGSDASSAIDIAGTWNTTGAPSALKLNITDTASDAASLLLDLQVGAASRFAVYKDAGAYFDGNLVEFRNSTNAQTLNIYGTYTDASNYERLEIGWGSNIVDVGPEAAGTGVVRPMRFGMYGEKVNAIGSIGGGTQDIDLTLGNVVTGTVDTSTTTFTFSNPIATGSSHSFTLILTNGGSQTVNWPASVDWAGGSAPTLTAAGVDVLTFITVDGGTTWYGFAAGLDMS